MKKKITLYLDDKIKEMLVSEAKCKGISLYNLVTSIIREKLENTWPKYIKNLAGSWKDFPEAEELRLNSGNDIIREEF